MNERRIRVAMLLSGSGRTLENFLGLIDIGDLPIEIVAVASSRGDVRGVEIARQADIPIRVFRRADFADAASHNETQNNWLIDFRPEMILLAGYLSYYLRPDGFEGPILNIHPALLPAYGGKGMYGDRVHAAVLAAGDTEAGCTVHHVTDVYDEGAIIAQTRVQVLPDDDAHSLADRVFAAERELYPRVVRDMARDILGRRME